MQNVCDAGPIADRSLLIEQEVQIAASTDRVFEALTDGVSGWWETSQLEGEVRLDPRVGGRFEELWTEIDGAAK